MARCTILASMSDVLQHQHQHQYIETAADIMLNLKELFAHQNCRARRIAMRDMLLLKIAEGGVKKNTSKGKCFKCSLKGHWRMACPQPKKAEKQGNSHALVIETCLAAYSSHSWVVDTGATDHVCFNT
ncbi:hypothetical protein ACS0TY_003493 [Phlomoides rotata]